MCDVLPYLADQNNKASEIFSKATLSNCTYNINFVTENNQQDMSNKTNSSQAGMKRNRIINNESDSD